MKKQSFFYLDHVSNYIKFLFHLVQCDSQITPSSQARNLGVIFIILLLLL